MEIENPYDSPKAADSSHPTPRLDIWSMALKSLAVVAAIGLLVALLLPVSRGGAAGAAQRSACKNNLRQIFLALQSYSDKFGCLPPAYTVDANGKPLHSWRTLILPFSEWRDQYESIDLSKPWNDLVNAQALATAPRMYRCHAATCPDSHTTYLAIVAPGSCLQAEGPRMLADITDPHESTLVVLEVDEPHAVHWMEPRDADETLLRDRALATQFSHRGGSNGIFLDGAVHFLTSTLDLKSLRALASIAGDENDSATQEIPPASPER